MQNIGTQIIYFFMKIFTIENLGHDQDLQIRKEQGSRFGFIVSEFSYFSSLTPYVCVDAVFEPMLGHQKQFFAPFFSTLQLHYTVI